MALKEENTGVGKAVHVEKLSSAFPFPTKGTLAPAPSVGIVEFPDHGGENVGCFQVKVVSGSVEVCGHDRNVKDAPYCLL